MLSSIGAGGSLAAPPETARRITVGASEATLGTRPKGRKGLELRATCPRSRLCHSRSPKVETTRGPRGANWRARRGATERQSALRTRRRHPPRPARARRTRPWGRRRSRKDTQCESASVRDPGPSRSAVQRESGGRQGLGTGGGQ